MRASVASLSKKLISTFFAATLALGLMPAAAFAVGDDTDNDVISSAVDEADTSYVVPSDSEEAALTEQNEAEGLTTSFEEAELENIVEAEDGSNLSIPAATERIYQDVTLATPVAQQESTRNYFLAQTLESTHTVPMLSASVPISSEEQTTEDSTVIGSFEYLGMTYAIEADGASAVLVAVDYSKLPHEFIEKQVIVVPESVTPDGIDSYSVTRIADEAFASLKKENADPAHVGCKALFSGEALMAEAGIDPADAAELASAGSLAARAGILVAGIPASVTSINDNAFADFDTLQYVVVAESNSEYASYDGALYSADFHQLRLIPEGRLGAVCIAPNATEVLPEVFSHCPSVDTLVADADSAAYKAIAMSDRGDVSLVRANADDLKVSSFAETLAKAIRFACLEAMSANDLSTTRSGEADTGSRDSYGAAVPFSTAFLGIYWPKNTKAYICYTKPGTDGAKPYEVTNGSDAAEVKNIQYLSAPYGEGFTHYQSTEYIAGYGWCAYHETKTGGKVWAYTIPAAYKAEIVEGGKAGVLYAGWNITFDGNGATLSNPSSWENASNYAYYPQTTVGMDGWTYGQWYEDANFTVVSRLKSNCRFSPALTGPITFYLRWTRNVMFEYQDKQDQTTTTATGVKKYGAAETSVRVEADISIPVRDDGWLFAGWSTDSVSESPEVMSISSNVSSPTWLPAYKYYGRWYKMLNLNTNDGYDLPAIKILSSDVAPYGNKATDHALPTPQKTGYVFTGWYADESCSGERLDDGTGVSAGRLKENAVLEGDTLYAGWGDEGMLNSAFDSSLVGFYYPSGVKAYWSYTKPADLDVPGGNNPSAAVTTKVDDVRYCQHSYYFTFDGATSVGYDEKYGWYSIHRSRYRDDDFVYAFTVPAAYDAKVFGNAVVLYAGYDVTWDGNGGSHNGGYPLPSSNYGYGPGKITGMEEWTPGWWWEDTEYTIPARLQKDGTYSPPLDRDITFYYKWSRDIRFDAQDRQEQTATTVTGVKDYGANVTSVKLEEGVEAPSRDDGWTFRGWSTDAVSESQGMMTISTTTSLPAYHYYGRWSKHVSFESNGAGSFDDVTLWSSSAAPYGNKAGTSSLPTPTKAGFIFTGWYADEDSAGSRADDGSGAIAGKLKENAVTANDVLYAGWAPALSVSVPVSVTALIDLVDIEEQVSGQGYIQSNSGGTLEVTQVDFEPFEGAERMFGDDKGKVFLEARVESSTSTSPDLRFALDATAAEADATKLAPFTLTDLNARKAITYRFDIPKDVLLSIDSSAFQNKTTPLGKVAYTVAVAG